MQKYINGTFARFAMRVKTFVTAAALALGLFGGHARAQETGHGHVGPVADVQVAASDDGYQETHLGFHYGLHNAVLAINGKDVEGGANLENDRFHANLGGKYEFKPEHGHHKFFEGRALGRLKFDGGFAGLEYQFLGEEEEKKDKHRYGLLTGATFGDLSLEAALDSEGNARGVAFSPLADGIGFVGGGGDGKGEWEGNLGYGLTFSKLGSIGGYARLGNDDYFEARLFFGQLSTPQIMHVFGSTTGRGINQLSEVGDKTLPKKIGGFDVHSDERFIGSKTLDFAIDASYVHKQLAFVSGALNVGDYGPLTDVLATGRWERDLRSDRDKAIVGLQSEVACGAQIWVEGEIDDRSNLGGRVMVGYELEFGSEDH